MTFGNTTWLMIAHKHHWSERNIEKTFLILTKGCVSMTSHRDRGPGDSGRVALPEAQLGPSEPQSRTGPADAALLGGGADRETGVQPHSAAAT